jgi:hypothetical protein
VDPFAEGDVAVGVFAGDVELLRVRKARGIAVGCRQDNQKWVTLGDRLPAQFDIVAGKASGRGLGRTVVTQDFLDRVRDKTRIGA